MIRSVPLLRLDESAAVFGDATSVRSTPVHCLDGKAARAPDEVALYPSSGITSDAYLIREDYSRLSGHGMTLITIQRIPDLGSTLDLVLVRYVGKICQSHELTPLFTSHRISHICLVKSQSVV